MSGICSKSVMKSPRHNFKSSLLTALLFLIAASAHSQDTDYTWVSTDGNPYDFTATLTLDSPSSSSGSIADAVYLASSFDYFGITDGFNGPNPIGQSDAFQGSLQSWNDHTINSMQFDPPASAEEFTSSYIYVDVDMLIGILPGSPGHPFTIVDYGHWEGPAGFVPDAAATLVMLISATGVLLLARHRVEIWGGKYRSLPESAILGRV
jgi:hypothetical protein